tara:strand:- start:402 stop:680 length:279 start_codon:yes stop_codon:yes gene_type:complete
LSSKKKRKKNKKKKKKGCIHPKIVYTYPIMTETTTKKTDQEKFFQERDAATEMRDDLCWLVGWTKADNPEISKRIKDILDNHKRNRVENLWF